MASYQNQPGRGNFSPAEASRTDQAPQICPRLHEIPGADNLYSRIHKKLTKTL